MSQTELNRQFPTCLKVVMGLEHKFDQGLKRRGGRKGSGPLIVAAIDYLSRN